MNHQCSFPATQHLSYVMTSNEPRPFPHWTHLGHDRETCASMSNTADHDSWTWSGTAERSGTDFLRWPLEESYAECLVDWMNVRQIMMVSPITDLKNQLSNFTFESNRLSRSLMFIKPTVILNYRLWYLTHTAMLCYSQVHHTHCHAVL